MHKNILHFWVFESFKIYSGKFFQKFLSADDITKINVRSAFGASQWQILIICDQSTTLSIAIKMNEF